MLHPVIVNAGPVFFTNVLVSICTNKNIIKLINHSTSITKIQSQVLRKYPNLTSPRKMQVFGQ